VTQSITEDPTVKNTQTHPAVWGRGLVRRFGNTTAVDSVDLNIAPGELYGLIGQNGAGTTTTIKTIVGLLRPDAGTVGIGEYDTSPRSWPGCKSSKPLPIEDPNEPSIPLKDGN